MAEVDIRDVAALAGVSIATVSNALHWPERVSAATVVKVKKAIAELGYVPNTAARQLRAGRSNVIGMAVINITNPFFSGIVLGAEEAVAKSGYSVIVGNSFDSTQRESKYLELFEQQRLDGVLIAPVGDDLSGIDRFRRRGVPVVLVDRVDPSDVHLSVSLDDVRGGMIATDHLIAGGARHIAFVGGPLQVTQMRDRRQGCRVAAEAAGVRLTEMITPPLSVRVGRTIGEEIADRPATDRPDSIFAANDEAALGILQSLIHRGISVPDEVAIIGYDDIDFASAAIVPLSSVRQPAHDIGVAAGQLLLDVLADADAPVVSKRFEPELRRRQSTRAV